MPRVISSLFHKEGRLVQPLAGLKGKCLQCSSILVLESGENATPFSQTQPSRSPVTRAVQLVAAGWKTKCQVCGSLAEFSMPIVGVDVAAEPQNIFRPSSPEEREVYLLTWSGSDGYNLNLDDPGARQRLEKARKAVRQLKLVSATRIDTDNSFSIDTEPLADYAELSQLVLRVAATFAKQMLIYQIQINLAEEIRHKHTESFDVTYPWS